MLTKCSQVPVAGLASQGSCRSGRVGAVAQQAQLGCGSRPGKVIRRREESSGPQASMLRLRLRLRRGSCNDRMVNDQRQSASAFVRAIPSLLSTLTVI